MSYFWVSTFTVNTLTEGRGVRHVLDSQRWLSSLKKAKHFINTPRLARQVIIDVRLKGAREKSRLKEIQKKLFLALDLLRSYMKGSYSDVSPQVLITLLAGMLYFLNPMDLIFDGLPIGLLDDAQVLLLVFGVAAQELEKYRRFKDQSRGRDSSVIVDVEESGGIVV